MKFYPTKYQGYSVNRKGEVYSDKRQKILKPKIDKDGYLEYGLSINGKIIFKRGHRIVAETFIPNTENKPIINHINGLKNDNRVENLEWTTYSENNTHRFRVLNTKPSCALKIDVYRKGKLVVSNVTRDYCLKMGMSANYIDSVHKKIVKSHFVYYEYTDKKVNLYWNGEIYKQFESLKIACKELSMKSNSLYTRFNRHKDVEYITKDYRLVFKDINK